MAFEKVDKEEAITTTIFWLVLFAIFASIAIIIATITTLHKMISPIGKVLEATTQDEIGILTTAFGNTVQTLKIVIADISRVLNEMASGNLNVEPTVSLKT